MKHKFLIQDFRNRVLSQHSLGTLYLSENESLEHCVVDLKLQLDTLVQHTVEPRNLVELRTRRLHFMSQQDYEELHRVADRVSCYCVVADILFQLLISSFEESTGYVRLLNSLNSRTRPTFLD